MVGVTLVVPCFNEASRLNAEAFALLLLDDSVHLLFVDDGSTDSTYDVLTAFRRRFEQQVDVLRLPENSGKAEAVRLGMLQALTSDSRWVGYTDADLATPAEEISRFLQVARETSRAVLLGSRVRLLGTDIARKPIRHYLGRVFATFASLTLKISVYDTQCGLKLFLAGQPLREALQLAFRSRWVFDVELMARLLYGNPVQSRLDEIDFLEIPLRAWRDQRGSKLSSFDMVRAAIDLLQIALQTSRWKLRGHPSLPSKSVSSTAP